MIYRAEPLSVLVVDDDNALLRTVADILEMHGYAPLTAETGSGGLATAAEVQPAIALVDLRLPDMNGLDLAARLHSLSDITQVVVLTGNASLESAVAAMRESSIDYLVKPVNVEHLLKAVGVAGERWQRLQAEAALRAMNAQQAAVAQLGERAFQSNDPDDIFAAAVQVVAETLDADIVRLLELVPNQQTFVVRAGNGLDRDRESIRIPADERSLAGRALQSGQYIMDADLAWLDLPQSKELQLASGVAVPIAGTHRHFGALTVFSTKPREFIRDDIHFLLAVVHIISNTVEREQREASFRQTQRLEAVGRLAGGVAHDFNNLLTAITGYSQLLLDDLPEDAPMRADIAEIFRASERASALTRQLLAFSRQQVLQPKILDINAIVHDMEKMLRRLIGADIELKTDLAGDLGTVKVDPGQVEQVIMNLVVNSRDALPAGGRIILETANVELEGSYATEHLSIEAGDYVMLAVSDNGTGMDRETRARIFEPFFTTKSADTGTGLGLATVYGIVKQSGGAIWVYSEPGHGTSFKIYFPRIAGEAAVTRSARAHPDDLRGTETILFAEDDEMVRRFAVKVLRDAGYNVLVAADGEEAVRIGAHYDNQIDLIATDVVMPRIRGQDIVRQVTALRPGTPVLYLSGYTDSAMLKEGVLEGSENFVQKPFTGDALLAKVRTVLTPR